MADNHRFKEMFDYLKLNHYVRNQQDFTERVGSDKTTISQIINNRITIPKSLFYEIEKAFPFISIDWLKDGEGEMIVSKYTQNVNGGNNVSQTGNINLASTEALEKAIDEIAEQRKLTAKAQKQIDRLIAIIEKITKQDES